MDKLDLSVLSDNELLAINALARQAADESCQGPTLRAITNALWDRVEVEMKRRGLETVEWFDLPDHFRPVRPVVRDIEVDQIFGLDTAEKK